MGIKIGDRFERLVVIEFIGKNKHGKKIFKCICDCGKIKEITDANLKYSTKSCGCLKIELIKENFSIDPELKKLNKKKQDKKYAAAIKKKNPEEFLKKSRIRTQRHRLKNKEKINQRHKERLLYDVEYLIKRNLRNRFKQALKNNYKLGSAVKLLGINIDGFKKYMEKLFKPNMSWSNYGQWHIDHIIPFASGDLTDYEFLQKVCHYTNLQPLWAKDNLSKGSKIWDDTETKEI